MTRYSVFLEENVLGSLRSNSVSSFLSIAESVDIDMVCSADSKIRKSFTNVEVPFVNGFWSLMFSKNSENA